MAYSGHYVVSDDFCGMGVALWIIGDVLLLIPVGCSGLLMFLAEMF